MLLRRLYRAISRRSYDQLRALKPVFGLASPRPRYRSKELRPPQRLHDLPPSRLRPISLSLDHGHLMAIKPSTLKGPRN